MEFIKIEGAREHNLKNVNVKIPKNKLVVITGLSGSGKSSLAFDTIYVEGQRRYMESLSSYVKRFLNLYNKPDLDSVTGISPTIAINQKSVAKNNRSTVATITEIYDYMRVLFARIGVPHSPKTGRPIRRYTVSQIVNEILNFPEQEKIYVMAPIDGDLKKYIKMGYSRFKIKGNLVEAEELEQEDLCLEDQSKLDKLNEFDSVSGADFLINTVIVDRIVAGKELSRDRLLSSVESACKLGSGNVYIEVISPSKKFFKFSEKAVCPETGFSFSNPEPRNFSFNVASSWCKRCCGIGYQESIDIEWHIKQDIPAERALEEFFDEYDVPYYFIRSITNLAANRDGMLKLPWKDLTKSQKNSILIGKNGKGIVSILRTIIADYDHKIPNDLIAKNSCPACNGYRLKNDALLVKIDGMHIGQVARMTVVQCLNWFFALEEKLTKQEKSIAKILLKEITSRLTFLKDVGLEYLSLDRESSTLSGGESQRIRLASQIGSGLTGIIYVLDEPSIGLHQCDNDRLIAKLKHLRDLGNTVIVVEHDDDTMISADYIIDVGPYAGQHGGQIVAYGTPKQIISNKKSLTGAYLCGEKKIDLPKTRRTAERFLNICGMNMNNLKNLEINLPLGIFTCFTGVSGSGKSTLVTDTLYRALKLSLDHNKTQELPRFSSIKGVEQVDKVIEVDQSPIGRAPFSNPATYTGIFDYVRSWFAELEGSKVRGYKPGRFSFNVKGGRCENCFGYGMIKVEMQIIADTWVICEECRGGRYNKDTLEITYKNKNISDILDMTVDELKEFFENIPTIKSRAEKLQQVGLGYLKVGQPSVYLSGGEAQRIKLAKELSKRATGKTVYILDEPTTGLHMHDVKNLLAILQKLVQLGNTVVAIEHNLHFVKTADYIFDIGPKGGAEGGYIVAQGSPEDIANNKKSVTGNYLNPLL